MNPGFGGLVFFVHNRLLISESETVFAVVGYSVAAKGFVMGLAVGGALAALAGCCKKRRDERKSS